MSIAQRTSWYFVSSMGAPIIGLMTLPLFTTRLGPQQFGSFALGSALAGLISATAGSVSTLSLPAELGRCSEAERHRYIAAVLLLSLFAATASSVIVVSLYFLASATFHLELLVHSTAILVLVGGLLNSVWATCVEILTIEGRARRYALTTFMQAVGNAIAVLVALFVFNDIEHALFVGFVGSAMIGLAGAVGLLAKSIEFRDLREWLPRAGRGAVASITASLSENGKIALERSYLGAAVGLVPLGLLANAQYYKNASMVVLNALSRGVLPTALEESRDASPRFSATLRTWRLVQAFVLALALGFACFGTELIDVLTHGKFIEAAPYAVALMVVLLLQTAAKPHSVMLLSHGQGHVYANLNTISIAVALAWLLLCVPYFGLWGAVSSFFLQTMIHRVAVYRAANRLRRVGFCDEWVVGGVIAVVATKLFVGTLGLGVGEKCLVLMAAYVPMLWMLRHSLLPVLEIILRRLSGSRL